METSVHPSKGDGGGVSDEELRRDGLFAYEQRLVVESKKGGENEIFLLRQICPGSLLQRPHCVCISQRTEDGPTDGLCIGDKGGGGVYLICDSIIAISFVDV